MTTIRYFKVLHLEFEASIFSIEVLYNYKRVPFFITTLFFSGNQLN